jgi:transposase
MQSDSSAASWVGIDVAQQWVDVVVLAGEQKVCQQRVERSSAALKGLAKTLLKHRPQAVILEATGGLEHVVMSELASAGLAVARMNPKRVRDFARAQGLLAKTDSLDAYALALFGLRMQPQAQTWPKPEQLELAAWQARQQQLIEQRAKERTRLHQCQRPALRKSVERVIAFLDKELALVEEKLATLVSRSDAWKQRDALLRSAPGVGNKTAIALMAGLPELGGASRREIAALAGLAPFARDSGNWRGRRRIHGGRAAVRTALYMASWTTIRLPGRLQDFYRRLVAAGKPRQLALIAVARKLLLALNEMLRSNQPWSPVAA